MKLRFLSIGLALCMAVTLFAGCSGEKTDDSRDDEGDVSILPYTDGEDQTKETDPETSDGGQTETTGTDSMVTNTDTTDPGTETEPSTAKTTARKTTGKTTVKKVTLKDSGVSTPVTELLDKNTASKAETAVKDKNAVVRVGSLENLLKILSGMGAFDASRTAVVNDGLQMESTTAAATTAKAAAATPASEGQGMDATEDHSTTNTKVEGVDESDILKTDGRYIYTLGYGERSMISIQKPLAGGKLERQALITAPDQCNFNEMYVVGNRLIVLGNRYDYYDYTGGVVPATKPAVTGGAEIAIWRPSRSYTTFFIYDISNRAKPVLARKVELEGYSITTRMVGNIIYFITQKGIYSIAYEKAIAGDVLPSYSDTAAGGEVTLVQPANISYCPESSDLSYMLVGAFDVTDDKAIDPQAFLGSGSIIHMNASSLYIARQDWADGSTKTIVNRFTVNGLTLTYQAAGKVEGYILNEYSMDEYDGYFRIATTYRSGDKNMNAVHILNAELKETGSVKGLAEGEQIYSVRFSGRTGYVVTYQTMDPLFVIDLSDPAAPRVLGELKIPGFSQYLHPLAEGFLVGFGRDTTPVYVKDKDGNEVITGIKDMGFKVSVFDVRDPENPKEVYSQNLGSRTYSDVSYQPKSVMFDKNKSVFAIPVYYCDADLTSGKINEQWYGGLVLEIMPSSGISVKARLKTEDRSVYNSRMCYVGSTLYMVTGSDIYAYDYNSYAQLAVTKAIYR